jgi:hypothetical protein
MKLGSIISSENLQDLIFKEGLILIQNMSQQTVKAQVRQNMCFSNDFSLHPQYGQN